MDLLTTEEAASAVGIADDASDDKLALYVSAISQRLDEACGPIVVRTITELHDGGTHAIYLAQPPVRSITSVTEYDRTASSLLTQHTNAIQTATSYALNGNRIARMRNHVGTRFAGGVGNLVIVYVAGRYDDTASVEDKFKLAATLMLRNLWRAEELSTQTFGQYDVPVSNFPTFAIPRAVRELLRGEWTEQLPGFA